MTGRRAVEPRRALPCGIIPFVAAKMSRPQTLRVQIRRQRLIERIDVAVSRPVTVVSAGAGWGKTSAVAAWAQTRRTPVGWLTVDHYDNDAQTFWSHVVATLRAAGALPAGNPLADLQTVPADDVERVHCLTLGLSRLRAGTVLVLDDFQEIDDPEIILELTGLLRQAPPQLHLILIGRSDPAVPLHRLRTVGDLAEVRALDLAFTTEEAADLLAGHGLELGSDDVAALLERTEGWPTGLQLASAFLTGPEGPRPVADFAGDVRLVDEYLANEVLADLPRHLRRFLLLTSICDRVCGDLADAITLQSDGQRTLEELERANGFVVRLGAKPQWFRYHRLLRDVLRHRLLLQNAAMVPELHRRAARWYTANHSIFEALGHAVAAQDWPFVGRLVVTQAGPLLVSADREALVTLLWRIPLRAFSSTAELNVCAALLQFDAGDYAAIPERLAKARRLLRDQPDVERLPVEITIRSLEMSRHRAVGDMAAVVALPTRMSEMLAGARFVDAPAAAQYRAMALADKGVGLLWSGRVDIAERYLWTASTAARAAGVELVEIDADGHLALLEIMSGSMREAARLAGEACALAERRRWRYAPQSVAAYAALVLVSIERNDLDGAQHALREGLRAHRQEPEMAQRVVWLCTQARLALARGDASRAQALLEEARRGQDPRIRAPGLDQWLRLTESQLDLLVDRPDRVEERYARLEDEPTFPERVCRARAAFAMRDVQRAEDLLAEAHAPMTATAATVEARILTALIADAQGHGIRAADALVDAFALAAKEGIRRPFLRGGDRLAALVSRQNLLTNRNVDFVRGILVEMTAGALLDQPPRRAGDLSERESEVLRYLPTMLTAGEIADELGVSVNTIKAHMKSIYRKLDAARRREAVARARELGLLQSRG